MSPNEVPTRLNPCTGELEYEQDVFASNNYEATGPPTVNDDIDEGYQVGSRWIIPSTGEEYVCTDNTDGAAVWLLTTGGFMPMRALHIGTQASVPQDTVTTVTTLPANGISFITQVLCTGEDNALWELYLDSSLIASQRTTNRTVTFQFVNPLKVLAAEVLDVKVTHHGSGTTASFDATIFGYQTA